MSARNDAGARRAHEGVLHGPGYGIETPGEHGECHGIHRIRPAERPVAGFVPSRASMFGQADGFPLSRERRSTHCMYPTVIPV